MKVLVQAAAAYLFAASAANAQQAVQWRVQDGGNGHWYQAISQAVGSTWHDARAAAVRLGADLASVHSPNEQNFIATVASPVQFWNGSHGPWLGGIQQPGSQEPSAGWRWIDGSPWSFEAWQLGEPNDSCNGISEDALHLYKNSGGWNDIPADVVCNSAPVIAAVYEWSADCNNDGIVDKGQILRGQLPDTNNNGIPDGCEVPSCIDADIYRDFNVNGADLGILLAQWGPNTPLTESDLNADGAVDGVDLGILLSFWGPCP